MTCIYYIDIYISHECLFKSSVTGSVAKLMELLREKPRCKRGTSTVPHWTLSSSIFWNKPWFLCGIFTIFSPKPLYGVALRTKSRTFSQKTWNQRKQNKSQRLQISETQWPTVHFIHLLIVSHREPSTLFLCKNHWHRNSSHLIAQWWSSYSP